MATHSHAAVQNENLNIYRGKGVDGAKVDVPKSEQKVRKDRKALADLSKARKPAVSVASKVSQKEKSVLRGSEIHKKASSNFSLTQEQARKCQEWAKEGIEQVHFTGNDMHKLQEDMMEERVRKKVEKVMSALSDWNNRAFSLETSMIYDVGMPMKVDKGVEDVTKFELEPEPLLPMKKSRFPLGDEEIDVLFMEDKLYQFPNVDYNIELQLKDD
ncbi:hypothetical protein QJS04_geneDACA015515 [Acorus gramineus]|uniref:Uncharacterized protein n=1 Tax=Acorus gramineus TaxID=55184 RepID=A0AAV9AS07_ACOGR|nr:hypothetical protein QJS04_geneDACA015515 [Acorus gramineus]